MRYTLSILLLCGCGVNVPPLAQQEIISNLTKPAWPVAQEGLNLTGNNNRLSMKGSLLIWDEQIDRADIERLSKVSLLKKQQSVNYEQVSQYVASERQRLQAALPLIDAQRRKVRTLTSAAYARARADNPTEWQRRQREQWDKGSAWLEARITELTTNDPHWSREHTDQILHNYCEGKIFAFAVSENLLRRRYTQRPTAHIMCENHYRALFADKPACQPAEDDAGRDYFQCIWLHGVLASTYFAAYYATVETQQERITALQQMLTDEPQTLKQLILTAYDNPAQRRHLKFYQRLGRIGFGERAITISPGKRQPFILRVVHAVESPAQLEDIVSLAAEHRIFNTPATSPDSAAQRNILISGLQAVAKTVAGVSVSDYRFNRDIAVPRFAAVQEGNCVTTGILSEAMEFLCNLRSAEALLPQLLQEVQLPLPAADQKIIAHTQQRLTAMQREYDDALAELEKQDLAAFDVYSQALDTAVNTARGPNMAQALFTGLQLQIVKDAQRYVVSFKLLERNDNWLTACIARTSGEGTSCGTLPTDQGQDTELFRASYVAEEGRLDLRFNLQQPARLGFASLSRASDDRELDRASFCDLTQAKFKDLQLDMELYANRFASTLAIITGSGKFQNTDDETVYRARVSFARELDI